MTTVSEGTPQRTGNATLPGSRRTQISEFVKLHGEASVADLADNFGVSQDTVRRDLERLDDLGVLSRTHGGAVALQAPTANLKSVSERQAVQLSAKKAIGLATAPFIHEGDTVILNGGTTTLEVARAISRINGLTIVTCSPNVMSAASEGPTGVNHSVYLIGGKWFPEFEVVIGPVALPGTNGINADVAVIGLGGLTATGGASIPNLEEAEMLRRMIDSATRVIVVADSTKLGRETFARIATLNQIDVLVTELDPSPELKAALTYADVSVIVATA